MISKVLSKLFNTYFIENQIFILKFTEVLRKTTRKKAVTRKKTITRKATTRKKPATSKARMKRNIESIKSSVKVLEKEVGK